MLKATAPIAQAKSLQASGQSTLADRAYSKLARFNAVVNTGNLDRKLPTYPGLFIQIGVEGCVRLKAL